MLKNKRQRQDLRLRHKKALPYTTISLVHAEDSSLVSFARADSLGYFKLNGVDKGSYLISSSYVGYLPVETC